MSTPELMEIESHARQGDGIISLAEFAAFCQNHQEYLEPKTPWLSPRLLLVVGIAAAALLVARRRS